MTFFSPEGVALSVGSVYVTIRAIPLLSALFGRNGNGKDSETNLLLREIRTAVEKIASNTEGQQGFIMEAREYFISGRRAIDQIDRIERNHG